MRRRANTRTDPVAPWIAQARGWQEEENRPIFQGQWDGGDESNSGRVRRVLRPGLQHKTPSPIERPGGFLSTIPREAGHIVGDPECAPGRAEDRGLADLEMRIRLPEGGETGHIPPRRIGCERDLEQVEHRQLR